MGIRIVDIEDIEKLFSKFEISVLKKHKFLAAKITYIDIMKTKLQILSAFKE